MNIITPLVFPGDLYFEKAVNGFLSDLFAKWKVCSYSSASGLCFI